MGSHKVRKWEAIGKVSELSDKELGEFHVRCHESFEYFCEEVLGYWDMNEVHREVCWKVQGGGRKQIFLLPRYTFKTCILTQGYILWRLYLDQNVRVLIYSESQLRAMDFLNGIRNQMLGISERGRFRELIGDWLEGGRVTRGSITLNNVSSGHSEPSIDTAGVETNKTGGHYEMIVYDDIVSKVNVGTRAMMDKTYEVYNESLALLVPRGKVVMVGTVWHFGDLYNRLMSENVKTKMYEVYVKDAEERNGRGRLIFEDIGLDSEHLRELRSQMGNYTYSCLMKNKAVDQDEAMFKIDNFRFYGRLKVDDRVLANGMYGNLYITCTVDPAGEGGKDMSAAVVVGTDSHMKMHILELFNRHCGVDEMLSWLMIMNRKYRFKKLGVETNFFRGLLERELNRRVEEERKRDGNFNMFGVEKFAPAGNKSQSKFVRIQGLQAIHERGEILFPGDGLGSLHGEYSELAEQMMQMTPSHMPEPNDLLDALAYQVQIRYKGGCVSKDEVPVNSPAWIERKWIEKHNKMQRHLPRRMRRVWQASFN